MIEQGSIIQLADIAIGEVYTDSIKVILGKLSTNSLFTEEYHGSTIEISDQYLPNLKVADMFGWSEVKAFGKLYHQLIPQIMQISIVTEHGKRLDCFDNTLIPIYIPDSIKKGFHGETKYEYKINQARNIHPGDILRVVHCKDEDDRNIYFDKVVSVDHRQMISNEVYYVKTKSRFMTCNDVYIYTD